MACRRGYGEDARTLSSQEAAWLAGIFDGEGNLTRVKGDSWRMSVTNTNYELLEQVQRVAGCGSLLVQRESVGNHAKCWTWTCYGKRLRQLIEQMLPWLIVKREKAEAALARRLP